MKHYLIEISDGDSKIKGYSVYGFDSFDKAMASYHQKMGNAMKSDLFKSEQIIVVDENNSIKLTDKWVNENYVEPTPEIETEE